MDDPISALDASVRRKIIMNLILKFLDIQMSSSEAIKETVALDFKYGVKKMDDKKTRI